MMEARDFTVLVTVVSIAILLLQFPGVTPIGHALGQGSGDMDGNVTVKKVVDLGLADRHAPLYDWLEFTIYLDVNQSGKYKFAVTLSYGAFDRSIGTEDTGYIELPKGNTTMSIRFPGEVLFNTNYTGVYTAKYELYKWDIPGRPIWDPPKEDTDNVYIFTKFYSPNNFPETNPRYRPDFTDDLFEVVDGRSTEAIRFSNEVLTVVFNKDLKRFEYYYSADNGTYTMFYLQLNEIIAYRDFNPPNGIYDVEEMLYHSPLDSELINWSDEPPVKGKNYIVGEFVTYNITYNEIPLYDPNHQISRVISLTLHLQMAALQGTEYGNTVPFGEKLSIGINVDFGYKIASIDGVVLNFTSYSRSDKRYYHDIAFTDAAHTAIDYDAVGFETMRRLPASYLEVQRMGFRPKYVSSTTQDEGYIEWHKTILTNDLESYLTTSYTYDNVNKDLTMYWAYKVYRNFTYVNHSIYIGVVEGNQPPKDFSPPKGPEPPNLLISISSAAAAILFIFLTSYLASRQYIKRYHQPEKGAKGKAGKDKGERKERSGGGEEKDGEGLDEEDEDALLEEKYFNWDEEKELDKGPGTIIEYIDDEKKDED